MLAKLFRKSETFPIKIKMAWVQNLMGTKFSLGDLFWFDLISELATENYKNSLIAGEEKAMTGKYKESLTSQTTNLKF